MVKSLQITAVVVAAMLAGAGPLAAQAAGPGRAGGSAHASVQERYTNPVLDADYSDPDIVCVDGEYWMTASSFNCVPGLQILHSFDLLEWEIVGAALSGDSPYWDGALGSPDHGNAVWAPSIRFRESDGLFYIFWGDPDRGIFQVHADDPRGLWSDPVCVIAGLGLIDPCPLFDDDGRVYLVHAWAGSRAGFKSVLNVCELDALCTRAIGEQVLVFDGNKNGNLTVEGPKFYKRDGRYWIFAPAGGVKTGWQLALRSDGPYGPYEWRRVCETAEAADVAAGRAAPTRAPHQGGWISDAAGQCWFMHFEDKHAWGRVVHLQPMRWTADGWCVIGVDVDGDGIGEPVGSYERPVIGEKAQNSLVRAYFSDTSPEKAQNDRFCALAEPVSATETGTGFTGPAIPLNWQWHGKPGRDWAMPNPSEGCLRLNCLVQGSDWHNLWDTPNLLLEKITGPSTELTSKLVFRPAYKGDRVGLVVMGTDYSTLELYFDGRQVFLQRRTCAKADTGTAEEITDSIPLEMVRSGEGRPCCTVHVRVSIADKDGAGWPPEVECRFSYSLDGKRFNGIGQTFTARAGKWIGAKAGFFAVAEVRNNDGGYVEVF